MKYRVADLQISGRYFWEGHIFDDKEYILACLIDFHSGDPEIETDLEAYTLEQICNEYGWSIEELTDEEAANIIADEVFAGRGNNSDWEEIYDNRCNDNNDYPYGQENE